ncbi:MAG: CADD family putative folate metabolism protein [Acidobacteriia bacterium]|nr:CADD family putative folate metabolism protein [Terriglobia bacterium]
MSYIPSSSTISILNDKIEQRHLLKHPFYRAWSAGELPLECLRHYSQQYFAHVRAFPAYLSEMHSRCADLTSRHIIAANLADEEATSPTHPELWLDFAVGLGVERDAVLRAVAGARMHALVEEYGAVVKLDTGLAAAGLYCYEKQIPAVSGAKIAGLREIYGINDDATLRYFRVHETADVEHAAQWENLILQQGVDAKQAAEVADRVLGALWGALDEVHEQFSARQATSC